MLVRTVRIIRKTGTKENTKPKEQAAALSQRLFAAKFERVR